MPRSLRFPLAILPALFLVTALLAAPAGAAELWVVPGKHTAHAEIGDWATTPAASTHFSFAVPDDFESLVAAKVVVIGQRTGVASYDLGLSVSRHMAPHGLFTASLLAQPVALVEDQLLEIDVTGIFPPLEPGIHYASLSFGAHPPGHARVVGLRFQYRASDPRADQTCPEGFVTGFDAEGKPVCGTRADLLAAVGECPAGKFLTGFDASGQKVCKTLGEVTGGGQGPPPGGDQSTLVINNAAAPEGGPGQTTGLVFTVTLARVAGAEGDTVTVDFATQDGTATTADNDYQAASGTLTFPPGVDTRTVTVLVSGDDVSEPDETFIVKLSNPTNAALADDVGLGTIVNDDDGQGR